MYNLVYLLYYLRWGLGIGDWGLGIGDWGFGIWAQTQKPQNQKPNPKPKNF